MNRIVQAIAALGVAGIVSGTTLVASAATVQDRAAACVTNWGTNAKQHGPTSTVSTAIADVRVGKHRCFDRLVIDLSKGPKPFYRAAYVRQILAEGSGKVLRVRGHARIMITVRGPAAPGYHPSAVNLANVSGFASFRQVRGAGSFERVTQIGLGVASKLPFRVFILGSAKTGWRLVLDVKA